MLRASVIVFPGSNCDRDVKVALEAITGFPVKMVWHGEASVPASDIIVLPGGFSYGDYLRCGAMAAHSPIMRDVIAKAKAGTPVLGICNGFQILCESGLLPGVLMRNASLKFMCRDVYLRVETDKTFYTQCYRKDQVIRIPIAHAEGNYFADKKTLDKLEGEGRVVFRYSDKDGKVAPELLDFFASGSLDSRASGTQDSRASGTQDSRASGTQDSRASGTQDSRASGTQDSRASGTQDSRASGTQDSRASGTQDSRASGTNPNGAQRNIAGICDASGRILGMMPHPERLYELALGGTDGRRIFESILVSVAAAA